MDALGSMADRKKLLCAVRGQSKDMAYEHAAADYPRGLRCVTAALEGRRGWISALMPPAEIEIEVGE